MLQVTRPIAHELLAQYVKQGHALIQRASLVGDFSDYESWKAARNQWIAPAAQALEHVYGGPTEAHEFMSASTPTQTGKRWQQQYATDLDCVKAAIALLISLQGDVALVRENEAALTAPELTASRPDEPTSGERYVHDARHNHDEHHGHDARHNHEEHDERHQLDEQPRESEGRAILVNGARPEIELHVGSELAHPPIAAAELERSPVDPASLAPAPIAAAKLSPLPNAAAELASVPVEESLPDTATRRADGAGAAPVRTKRVFVAHGRNGKWKQAVADLLDHAGSHEVAILNEPQPEQRTLVEQLEEQVAGSHYAIVVLTADDVGGERRHSADEPYYSPRARQAVVFELGFLVAALSPKGVCVLYEEGVELPCAIDGIAYVRLDIAGTWQSKLLLRLRKAGFDYDLNKLAPV